MEYFALEETNFIQYGYCKCGTRKRVLLLFKKVDNARAEESDWQSISPKIKALQYQPIEIKKRKWKL